MIKIVKKHKERVTLIGVGLAFLLFFGLSTYFQKTIKLEKKPPLQIHAQPIQLHSKSKGGANEQLQKQEKNPDESTTQLGSSVFFLKPSPGELMEQLGSMENLTEQAVDAKFSHLPVLWPAYFFNLRETEDGRKILSLDVSEDGFGVVIQSELDLNLYPQLRELDSGEKIWIGGNILAVDRAGTGTIHLQTEQLRIGDEPPFKIGNQGLKN
ncbi:MAG: hypothetical protein WBB19_12540 [Desulforhopalus sp.]